MKYIKHFESEQEMLDFYASLTESTFTPISVGEVLFIVNLENIIYIQLLIILLWDLLSEKVCILLEPKLK